jgi:ER lumen protein retaining receptor
LIGAAVMALIFPDKYTPFEIVWTFSLFLESVAIMPQLQMMQSSGGAEALTFHYIFLLGGYRALYLLNWIERYWLEGYTPYNAWLAGLIQTALYADFFYIYVKKVWKAARESLPK